jgi:glycosyltransferase involved in cell wall biosynthesis
MNVLVVSSKYPPEYAGSGLRAHNTYKRLKKKYGINFRVITSSITENKSRTQIYEAISVKRVARKTNLGLSQIRSDTVAIKVIKKFINKCIAILDYWLEAIPVFLYLIQNRKWFDIIHIFGNVSVTSVAITYSKLFNIPIIIELVNLTENPHQYEPLLISLIFGKKYPSHALIVCISKYLNDVCTKSGYSNDQIWCRPNPVDESRFFFERNRKGKYRRYLKNIDSNDQLLLYLAKFMPLKEQLFLIDVMNYLPQKYKLILAGPLIKSGPMLRRDHDYFQSIVDSIQKFKLENRVTLIPKFVNEPQTLIKAADVFLIPSNREAFGTPVMEALACGVPVVANDLPGVFDQWIENNVNGFIARLDPKEWAKKITNSSQFCEKKMSKVSQNILKVASTKVVDYGYFCRINTLVEK